MNTRKLHLRRGMAMLIAVALVSLVGMAIAAVLALVRLELTRTADTLEDAQLRQMLLAGETAAREKLSAMTGDVPKAGEEVSVPLPAALAADGAALHLRIAAGPDAGTLTTREVVVEATVGRRTLGQRLNYERDGGDWRLSGVVLGRPTTAK